MTKNKYKRRAQEEMNHIGPISSKLFAKLQILLDEVNEAARYEVCYNMILMMIDQEGNEDDL